MNKQKTKTLSLFTLSMLTASEDRSRNKIIHVKGKDRVRVLSVKVFANSDYIRSQPETKFITLTPMSFASPKSSSAVASCLSSFEAPSSCLPVQSNTNTHSRPSPSATSPDLVNSLHLNPWTDNSCYLDVVLEFIIRVIMPSVPLPELVSDNEHTAAWSQMWHFEQKKNFLKRARSGVIFCYVRSPRSAWRSY